MADELTDAQKIERLWERVDMLTARNDNLQAENDSLRDRIKMKDDLITGLNTDIIIMSKELNQAREAAATSVTAYKAEIGR